MRSRSRIRELTAKLMLCLAALLTVAGVAPAPATETPGDASFDFSPAVAAGNALPRLNSLLVSYRGKLVLEQYFHGWGRSDLANVKSVSKSILSALIGIAIEQHYIAGLDIPIERYFPGELEPEKCRITVEDLLTMQAGLRPTSNQNYGAWVASGNWVSYALHQPLEAAPGSRLQYSTGNTHLLSAILTQATGRSTFDFAREALAEPLGFTLAPWPVDPQGIYFGGNDMRLTARQMLAFGELYLHDGTLGGRRIVPGEWTEASLRPHAISPEEQGRYYGYGWWITTLEGHRVPHAWGYGGQFIMLVPDLDLVIVSTSSPEPGPERSGHANAVYQMLQRDVIRVVDRTRGRF